MNESSSNIVSHTFTNRTYMTVSDEQMTDDSCDLHPYDNRRTLTSFRSDVLPLQRQPIKQMKNHSNQNQRPSSRQTQSVAKISVKASSTSTSATPSISMLSPNETASIQKTHQNKQSEYAAQRPARRKNKNNSKKNKTNNNIVAVPNKQLTSEHLGALKATFDKISSENFLSKSDHEQHLNIYRHLRDIIRKKRPDTQISLYGSLLFECCLKEANIIDIDIQFNEILPYKTLKELLEIVRSSAYCKEAHINVDRESLSIDLSIVNSNILVRLTSNNTHAVQLSKIIQIYVKFDERVLPLFRLFRILSKICNIDRPDLGTLHPIVFHLMVIHFLQQVDPPVLPCLHEYVYGIDKSPVALNEDQYTEFFQVCRAYINRWKSKNTTSVEMLFLQLLSYYVGKFNLTRFIVSIQTRMPILKKEKQTLNRKFFCLDPTSLSRNLSYTMKAFCSFNYFRRTLTKALNYFCQEQKHENLNEVKNENDETISVKQLVNAIDKSYKLFIERFPKKIHQFTTLKQEDIQEYYKQTFDEIENPLPKPILKLYENNKFQLLQENDDEEISQHDLEIRHDTMNNNDDDEIEENSTVLGYTTNNENIVPFQNQLQSIDEEEKVDNQSYQENPILFKTLSKDLNVDQKKILYREYYQQVKIFNNKVKQILNDIKSSSNCLFIDEIVLNESHSDSIKESVVLTISTESNSSLNNVEQTMITNVTSCVNYPNLFYLMQAKNFGAEKGAPSVCTICYRSDHIKSDCPELALPNIIVLPTISNEWFNVVSRICRQIRDQCKLTKQDEKNREQILKYLQNEFEKCYHSCLVHAYGSSHNGFGFRQSDLDISVTLKDNNEQSNIIILEKFFQILNSKPYIFKDVVLIREARVPIIRSIHSQFNIEVDISLHNVLAMENTRLLKMYTDIDPRVSELGCMVKHLVKTCDIGDARFGTLSSYAYIIMIIHFLQQIEPSVLPVLQQLNDDRSKSNNMIRECNKWNVYFFDNLSKLKKVWINKNGPNRLTTGELWIAFLRYYTEQFDYEQNVITIRQFEPLRRDEKGWFHPTIAIEDPFIITHNLADKLSVQKWALIRRVFIRARQRFGLQTREINIYQTKFSHIQAYLFDINILCPENTEKFYQLAQNSGVIHKESQESKSIVTQRKNEQNDEMIDSVTYIRMNSDIFTTDQQISWEKQSMCTNSARTFTEQNRRATRPTAQ